MTPRAQRGPLLVGLALVATCPLFSAQASSRPRPTAIQNVTLGRAADGPKATLILRDGRIAEIAAADAELPPGLIHVDGSDLHCLPAFLDGYTRSGVETPEPVKDQDVPVDVGADVRIDMRQANRKGLQPTFLAADAMTLEEEAVEAWQATGFGAALVSPSGQLLAGSSTLAVTREAAARDLVLRPQVFAHGAFQASGPSYPSTLMGYMAQLRQFFLDATHQRELTRRYQQNQPGPRPAHDPELQSGVELLDARTRLASHAESSRDMERWMKLSDEFGFRLVFSGGREGWRVAEELVERNIPVLLTLEWGDEVDDPAEKDKKKGKKDEESKDESEGEESEAEESDDSGEETEDDEPVWEYSEPLAVRSERRREWVEVRDNAIRLHEAGVRFAFGTGSGKPKKLLEKVRTLVEEGLPAEAAEAALTTGAAQLFGVEGRIGTVEVGRDATLSLWTGDPLTDKKAKVAWSFVDGFGREFEVEEAAEGGPPADGVDLSGTWTLTAEMMGQSSSSELEVEMDEEGAVTGTIKSDNPRGGDDMQAAVTGQVSGETVTLSYTFEMGEFEIEVSFEGEVDGDELTGTSTIKVPMMEEPMTQEVTGTREPGHSHGEELLEELSTHSCHEGEGH